MSLEPVPFERLAQIEAENAVAWYQHLMRLEDWIIRVEVHDGPPAWWEDADALIRGATERMCQDQGARIWVSNLRCSEGPDAPYDPLTTLFHECEHVRGSRDGTEPADENVPYAKEFANTCVGRALARLYRWETGQQDGR